MAWKFQASPTFRCPSFLIAALVMVMGALPISAALTPADLPIVALVGNLFESNDDDRYSVRSQWFAAPFETDAHDYALYSVTLRLTPGQFPQPELPLVRIHEADVSGAPGLELGSLINPSLPRDQFGNYTFTANGEILLRPNSRYLICIGSLTGPGVPDQRATVHFTLGEGSVGPGVMPGGIYYSSTQGASWNLTFPTFNGLFQVDVQQVESSLVRLEFPVTFSASSTIFFKAAIVDVGLATEATVITMPDGRSIRRPTTPNAQQLQVLDADGNEGVLTALESAALEKIGFNTGWIPPGSPIQLRISFNASEGTVDVAEAGKLIVEYDPREVGPGVELPIRVSWTSAPNDGSTYMDGGVTFSAEYKFDVLGVGAQGGLPGIPNPDIGWVANELFQPHVLGGRSVVSADDFEGVPFLIGPDVGVANVRFGADIEGTATGILRGQQLCVELNGEQCVLADNAVLSRTILLSATQADTSVPIPQDYHADYDFDLDFHICPNGCVEVGICPFCSESCIRDFVSSPCVDLKAFDDYPVDLSFNQVIANLLVEGFLPEITDAPSIAAYESRVQIEGLHFGAAPGQVFFGNTLGTVESWSNDSISAIIPPNTAGNDIVVQTVVGQGEAWPCDIVLVPVLLSGFEVAPSKDGVRVDWSVSLSADQSDFRLFGRRESANWPVEISMVDETTFRALDASPQRFGSGLLSYRLEYKEVDGRWVLLAEKSIDGAIPQRTRLLAASPNPFNPKTTVRYELREPGRLSVVVYDISGRLVRHLIDEERPAGYGEVVWSGVDDSGGQVASGIYLVQLLTPNTHDSKKLVLLK